MNVAFQMPLYPMLDDRDTETSRDNHGKVWNTRRNHFGWRCYLRGQKRGGLSPYAAPARQFNEQFAYAQTHYFAPQGESER